MRRLAVLATLLCLSVVVFGGFVRLGHAGLSCSDWPTCYGKAAWPTKEHEIATANIDFPQRAVEVSKAWREQLHRHLAAVLGSLILALALISNWQDRRRRWLIIACVPVLIFAILLYNPGGLPLPSMPFTAFLIAAGVELALVAAAFSARAGTTARLTLLLLALVIFQALLGKWTVTMLVKPIIVMAHLIGGLSVLGLLGYLVLSLRRVAAPAVSSRAPKRPLVIAVFVLLTIQIALGGWVSSNYAALACPDFPACQGRWLPKTDFSEAFVLWRGVGVDYEGGVLDGPARVAIHLTHRWFALIAGLALFWLAWRAWREPALRAAGGALALVTAGQMALGISNVVFGLPLWVATAHNAGAAGLTLLMVYLLWRTRPMPGSLQTHRTQIR